MIEESKLVEMETRVAKATEGFPKETLPWPFAELHYLLTELRRLQALTGSLFDAIRHGDDEHKAWLKAAIDAHFADKPVPALRGSGNKEAEIARLQADNAALRKALEPFAAYASSTKLISTLQDCIITQGSPMARRQLTMGDCHAARTALEK